MMKIHITFVLTFLQCWVLGQQPVDGPIIKGFGHVYSMDSVDLETDSHQSYWAMFDVNAMVSEPSSVNMQINTVARFLNMHTQAGVSPDSVKVAAIFHGDASTSLLSNQAYQMIYGVDNPNISLLKQIFLAGGDLILCGQSMRSNEINRSDLLTEAKVALSAMTAIISFEAKGYVLISF